MRKKEHIMLLLFIGTIESKLSQLTEEIEHLKNNLHLNQRMWNKMRRKLSNPARYCTGCNFILMEDEHNEDAEGNEYCDECKSKVELLAGE